MDIHKRAPRAEIYIPQYPMILNVKKSPIDIGTFRKIKEPQAAALERFGRRLDETIANTVTAWNNARKPEPEVANVITGTFNVLIGHQLGDAERWVNGWIRPEVFGKGAEQVKVVESLHPNCKGHIAVARAVAEHFGMPAARIPAWTCP
jgi:hypothetical protein